MTDTAAASTTYDRSSGAAKRVSSRNTISKLPMAVPNSIVCRPQLYISGEIECASAGTTDMSQMYCSFRFRFVRQNWCLLAGTEFGETFMSNSSFNICNWNHPIDAHFVAMSMEGWPRLELVVRGQDSDGRNQLAGYGSVLVPTRPGTHEMIVQCWRPVDPSRRLRQCLLGETPEFLDSQLGNISEPNKSKAHIQAENSVEVMIRFNMVLQYFKQNNLYT